MTSFFSTAQNLSSAPSKMRDPPPHTPTPTHTPIPEIFGVSSTSGAKDRDGGTGGKLLAMGAISGDGDEAPTIKMLWPPCCSFSCRLATAPGAPTRVVRRSGMGRGATKDDSREKQMRRSEPRRERERNRMGGKTIKMREFY